MLIFDFEEITHARRGEALCERQSLPLKGTQKIFIKDSEAIRKLLVISLMHSNLSFHYVFLGSPRDNSLELYEHQWLSLLHSLPSFLCIFL